MFEPAADGGRSGRPVPNQRVVQCTQRVQFACYPSAAANTEIPITITIRSSGVCCVWEVRDERLVHFHWSCDRQESACIAAVRHFEFFALFSFPYLYEPLSLFQLIHSRALTLDSSQTFSLLFLSRVGLSLSYLPLVIALHLSRPDPKIQMCCWCPCGIFIRNQTLSPQVTINH